MHSPHQLDQRSLALHRLAAEKLRRDGTLLVKVNRVLDHWFKVTSPRTHVYLYVWQAAVDQGVEACIAVAEDDSERGASLRQSSPMTCLLTNRERFSFIKQWAENHAPQ